MTDYDALYAAILDRPEDDTPRLVLADWCDDHGDPERAEFIRVQMELARGDELHWRMNPLRFRTADILDKHAVTWAAPLDVCGFEEYGEVVIRHHPHLPHGRRPTAKFRRGFVSEVRLSLAAFMGEGCDCSDAIGGWGCPTCQNTGRVPGLALKAELFAAHPITRVVLTDREPHPSNLLGGVPAWHRDNGDGHTANLPAELFNALVGQTEMLGRLVKYYPTRDDAMTALSDACVVYGRALAGLRPLTVGGRPA